MITLIRLFVFLVVWVVLGQVLTHFFYPELWESETTRNALPWLLLIGYTVGTLGDTLSKVVGMVFKRE